MQHGFFHIDGRMSCYKSSTNVICQDLGHSILCFPINKKLVFTKEIIFMDHGRERINKFLKAFSFRKVRYRFENDK